MLFKLKILSYDYVYNYAIHRKARKRIMGSYSPDKFYLNIGGGLNESKENWRILEYCGDPILRIGYRYHHELIDYNIDLMAKKKWDINDNSVDLIYTSHCLEHLTQDATNVVFAETKRVLKDNGVFRISVPDADLAYNALKNNDVSFFDTFQASEKSLNEKFDDDISGTIEARFLKFFCTYKLNHESLYSFKSDVRSLKKEDLFNKYRDKQILKNNYHAHLNWFNFKKLKEIAINYGFNSEKFYFQKKILL